MMTGHGMQFRLEGQQPVIAEGAYVAPSAVLIGDVRIGPQASVWFGAVLRGDNEAIIIGSGCNVQDNCVLHADPGFPLELEENVSAGHLAMLHGCRIGAGSLIGIGAVILNGAIIGRNCLIAAKTFIGEGRVIPDNSIVRGMPGQLAGQVTDKHAIMMTLTTESYIARTARYAMHLTSVGTASP